MANRNNTIDLFKGITILSVLNIHTLFWSGALYIPDWAREASLLWDIPIFFFISGVLIGKSRPEVLIKCIRQGIRIYSNYLLAVGIAFAVALVITAAKNQPLSLSIQHLLYSIITMRPIGGIWDYVPVFGLGSLWYLRIHLLLLPLATGILLLPNSSSRFFGITGAAVVWALLHYGYIGIVPSSLLNAYTGTDVRGVFFFLIVFLCGTFASDLNLIVKRHILICELICAGLLILTLTLDQFKLIIQAHKFPPSFSYIPYFLPSILIFVYTMKSTLINDLCSRNLVARFLCWCGSNSLILFLYQGIAASLPFFYVKRLIGNVDSIVIYVGTFFFILCCTLGLCVTHTMVRRIITFRKFNKKWIASIFEKHGHPKYLETSS